MEDFARIVLRSPKGGGGGGGKGGGGSKGGKSKGSSGSSSSRPGGGVYVGGGGGVGPQPLWLVIVFSIIAFFIVLFLSILIFLALRDRRRRKQGRPVSSGSLGRRAAKITFGIAAIIWVYRKIRSLHGRRKARKAEGGSYAKLHDVEGGTAPPWPGASSVAGPTSAPPPTHAWSTPAERYEPFSHQNLGTASLKPSDMAHLPPPTPATIAASPMHSPGPLAANAGSTSGLSTPGFPTPTTTAMATPSPAPPPAYGDAVSSGGGSAAEYFSGAPLGTGGDAATVSSISRSSSRLGVAGAPSRQSESEESSSAYGTTRYTPPASPPPPAVTFGAPRPDTTEERR